MKKLLAPFLAIFSASSVAQPTSKVETIDPGTVRYSMPTVAADSLEFAAPSRESFEGAPQFHEDEWSQVEFFPASRLGEIKKLLSEYKPFEQANREQHGWSNIFARRIARHPVVAGSNAVERISKALYAQAGNAPILFVGSGPLGQVKRGFSVPLAPGVVLYGLKNEKGVDVLAAHLSQGADDMALTRAFVSLHGAEGLCLVDWRSQMILVSGGADSDIVVWRP